MKKYAITEEGLANTKKRYEFLVNVLIPKTKNDVDLARSQGDLSENADYDAAINRLQELNDERGRLLNIIDNHELIKAVDSNIATLGGKTVHVINLSTGQEYYFKIVGSSEADPLNHKISNTSPVALAVSNHRVGDVVEVKAKVPYQMEITKLGD